MIETLILWLVVSLLLMIVGITLYLIPNYLEYYKIYKDFQETFGHSNFECFWNAWKEAFYDFFHID